jgi:hypothetical protein
MYMKKLLLLTALFVSAGAVAQFKVAASGGLSPLLHNKSSDTLHFINKAYHYQLKLAWYSGRIGWTVQTGQLRQQHNKELPLPKDRNFLRNTEVFGYAGADITSTYITAGPELCICAPRIKIVPAIRAGIALHQSDSVVVTTFIPGSVQRGPGYTNKTAGSSFVFNPGINFYYKVVKQFGIGFNIDWLRYTQKTENRDFRRGLSNVNTVSQQRSLLNTGLAFTYIFK